MKHQHNQRVHLTHPKFLTTTWLLATLTLLWATLVWATDIPPAWRDALQNTGTARVIVVLNVPVQPEGTLNDADAIVAQRADIAQAQQLLLDSLQPQGSADTRFETIPALVMVADSQTLTQLQDNPLVASLQLDAADEAMAGQTIADQVKELERVYESSHSYAQVTEVTASPASAREGDVRELIVANLQSVGITVARGEESSAGRQVRAANPGMPVASCGGVTAGLVACYPFDGDAKDYSGNGLHGQTYGVTLTEDRFGNPNAAYQFYGNVNSYIEVQDHALLDLTSSLSFSLWIKQYGVPATGYRLIDKITSCGGDGYLLDIYDGNITGRKMRFYTKDYYLSSLSQTAYSLNEWHHLALTFANGTYQFYLDGVPNGTGSVSPAVTNNLTLLFGKAHPGNCQGQLGGLTENFLGLMDDLRIYNRALSETEVKQLYGKETLIVTKTGYGNVAGQGINCGTVCGLEYANGSKITLTAVPMAYATFTGWSGDCTGTGTTVDVTMDKAKSCVATFSATLQNPANGHTYQLINWGMPWQNGVDYCASQGGYLATITSQSEQDFVYNTLCAGKSMCLLGGWQERSPRAWRWITGEAWSYSHWKPSNGSGDGQVAGMYGVMGSAKNAYPSTWNDFKRADVGFPICEWNPPVMTLTVTKTGNGKVTGQGVNCGTDCAENYAKGSSVTLTAVPVTGATFTGWSGDCTGTATTVNLTMDKAKSCVATFSATITNSANGHTYQLVNQGMTWSQGKDYCASQGGYLATITSQSEQDFVFNNLCAGNSYCLLGGTYDGQVGKWRWITNEAWGYTHWNNPGAFLGSIIPILGMYGMNASKGGKASNVGKASFWDDHLIKDRGFPICEWGVPKVTLTVTNTGEGQVTGNGITCGTDCTEDLALNTQVTLTATATTGSMFKQWTGDCTGINTNATVTMDKAKSCTATFEKVFTLTVSKTGTGAGSITGTGISCGSDCTEDVVANTPVTLTATATTGSSFTGWSGACTGTNTTVTVTLDQAKSCTATFDKVIPKYTLTVAKTGTGTGSITGTGITCGTDCTEDYNAKTLVTLTATPDTGSQFVSWGGDCSGTATTATVTMTTAKTCTANFAPANATTFTLTVAKAGAGQGTIRAQESGQKVSLVCNATCATGSYDYPLSSVVTLTAAPATGFTFKAWSCDGSYQKATNNIALIHVPIDAAKTCTATFE